MPNSTACRQVSHRPAPAPGRQLEATGLSGCDRHAVLALPAREAGASTARRFAAGMLHRWGLASGQQDTALLVIGELTANAAQHGRADMTLRLALSPGWLQIIVADHGDPAPRATGPCPDPDEHGRGLEIVTALAARLRVHPGPGGRTVHAALCRTDP